MLFFMETNCSKAHVTKHLCKFCFLFFDVGENTGSDESVGTCGNPFVTTRGRQCVTYNANCTMKRDYVKKKKEIL